MDLSHNAAKPLPVQSALERAIAIAVDAHAGQFDKAGAPYVLHPLRMMLRMRTAAEMMAAVLHDVVEDGPGWSLERLAGAGIPADVLEAVECLTKRREEEGDYDAFIRRAGSNPMARRVKLADLEDNMDPRRIAHPVERDVVRIAKYRRAHAWLSSAGDPSIAEFKAWNEAVAKELVANLNAGALAAAGPQGLPPDISANEAISALAAERDNMAAFASADHVVPIDALVSIWNATDDVRERNGAECDPRVKAAKRMVSAILGQTPARMPLTVLERSDGKYDVLDGNATLEAAKLARWTRLPISEGRAPL
ncbi:MAG: hypothetical protein ABI771_11010 [Betaproteobacteria bacterium]